MGWLSGEFVHYIFNVACMFESRVPILLLNSLFKRLAKRLARRGRLKGKCCGGLYGAIMLQNPSQAGMFYM